MDNYLEVVESAADTLERDDDTETTEATETEQADRDDGLVIIYKLDNSNKPCGVKPRHRQYKYNGGGSLRVEPTDAEILVAGGEWGYGG